MTGTRAGGIKTRDKVLAANPNHYHELGAKGGKISHGGGFKDREAARYWGKIGGKKSIELRRRNNEAR